MKIQYMSDLHLEFGGEFHIPKVGDVLVVAGDCDLGDKSVGHMNNWAQIFDHVIFVAGNHEFYHNEWFDVHSKLLEGCADNVHYLNKSKITIDNVDFVGGTLWTDMDGQNMNVIADARYFMNDYRIIVKGPHTLRPQDTIDDFYSTMDVFEKEIDKDRTTVVITHHSPSYLSVSRDYKGDRLNGAYVTNLHEFIEEKEPEVWIHGHVHACVDEVIGNTKLLCNPRGYYGHALNPEFDVFKCVEV